MFRAHLRSIVITALLLMGILVVSSADEATVKKAITAEYSKRSTAFKTKDLKGLFASSTSDMTVKRRNGTILTRAQLEKDFKTQFINTKTVKECVNQITKLEVQRETTVAYFKSHVVVVLNQGGRYHEYDSTVEGRDTWVKTSSGWKLKFEEVSKETVQMDGKKLQ